jgi:hypothetical protein
MSMPGFTATASLYRTSGHHYRNAAPEDVSRASLIPALRIGHGPGWVDCNEPFAYYCIECGGTGPGSIRCCPDDNCFVIDRLPGRLA